MGDDLLSKLLIGLACAAAGALLGRLLARPKERQSKTGAFLEAICEALRKMIEGFKQNEVPREYGHAFVAMLETFMPIVEPILGTDAKRHLLKLDRLAREAMKYDGYIDKNKVAPQEVAEWIKDAQRVVGELTAICATLK